MWENVQEWIFEKICRLRAVSLFSSGPQLLKGRLKFFSTFCIYLCNQEAITRRGQLWCSRITAFSVTSLFSEGSLRELRISFMSHKPVIETKTEAKRAERWPGEGDGRPPPFPSFPVDVLEVHHAFLPRGTSACVDLCIQTVFSRLTFPLPRLPLCFCFVLFCFFFLPCHADLFFSFFPDAEPGPSQK